MQDLVQSSMRVQLIQRHPDSIPEPDDPQPQIQTGKTRREPVSLSQRMAPQQFPQPYLVPQVEPPE